MLGINIYFVISWDINDLNALIKSNTLIKELFTIITNLSLNLTSPLNNLQINNSLLPLSIISNALPIINYITTTYISLNNSTNVNIYTVGLYDNIALKTDNQDDNCYIRLKGVNQRSTVLSGINPIYNTIITSLFNSNNEEMYSYIQTPAIYLQQNYGINGDIYNTVFNYYITLNTIYSNFTITDQNNFISAMNSATGGNTTIISITSDSFGNTVINYSIIFDVTKSTTDINNIIGLLTTTSSLQTIIALSTITPNKPYTLLTNIVTTQPAILSLIYNNSTNMIIFKTIGPYTYIAYQAPNESTFLTSTSKTISLPPNITTHINAKLQDINGNDLTTAINFFIDTVPPTIILINNPTIYLELNNSTYIEYDCQITDASGLSITSVKTYSFLPQGSSTPTIQQNIVTTQLGTYIVTYTATNIGGVTSTATRTVIIRETASPTISLNGNNIVYIGVNNSYTELNCTVTDESNTTITPIKTYSFILYGQTTPVIKQNIDTTQIGIYIITYTATNLGGITSTVTRTVNIINFPTITLTGNNPYYIAINTSFSDPGYSAVDNYNIPLSITPNYSLLNVNVLNSYNITYTTTDSYNLSSTVSRVVIVKTPPTITITGGNLASYTVSQNSSYTIPTYTATYNIGNNLTAIISYILNSITPVSNLNTANLGTYTVTYTVTYNNFISSSSYINVIITFPQNLLSLTPMTLLNSGINYNSTFESDNTTAGFGKIYYNSFTSTYFTTAFANVNYTGSNALKVFSSTDGINWNLIDLSSYATQNYTWINHNNSSTHTYTPNTPTLSYFVNNNMSGGITTSGVILLCITGYSPTSYLISYNNGLNWILSGNPPGGNNIITAGNMFFNTGGNTTYSSIDGINWNLISSLNNVVISGNIIYTNNIYVAYCSNNMFYKSNDSINWTLFNFPNSINQQVTLYSNASFQINGNNFIYANGIWVFMLNSTQNNYNSSTGGSYPSLNFIITSPDLVNFTVVELSQYIFNCKYYIIGNTTAYITNIDITYHNGTFIILSKIVNGTTGYPDTTYFTTSSDGINWLLNSTTIPISTSGTCDFMCNINNNLYIPYGHNLATTNVNSIFNLNGNCCPFYYSSGFNIILTGGNSCLTINSTSTYIYPGYTVYNGSTIISPTVNTNGVTNVNTSIAGQYLITYNVPTFNIKAGRVVTIDTINTNRRIGSKLFTPSTYIGMIANGGLQMPEGAILNYSSYCSTTNYIFTFAAIINIISIPDNNYQVIQLTKTNSNKIYLLCFSNNNAITGNAYSNNIPYLSLITPTGLIISTCPIYLNSNNYISFSINYSTGTVNFTTSTNICVLQNTYTTSVTWINNTDGFSNFQIGADPTLNVTYSSAVCESMTGSISNIVISDQNLPFNILFPYPYNYIMTVNNNISTQTINLSDSYNNPTYIVTQCGIPITSPNVIITGSVNTAVSNCYVLIYTFTDPSGNVVTTPITVFVGNKTFLGSNNFNGSVFMDLLGNCNTTLTNTDSGTGSKISYSETPLGTSYMNFMSNAGYKITFACEVNSTYSGGTTGSSPFLYNIVNLLNSPHISWGFQYINYSNSSSEIFASYGSTPYPLDITNAMNLNPNGNNYYIMFTYDNTVQSFTFTYVYGNIKNTPTITIINNINLPPFTPEFFVLGTQIVSNTQSKSTKYWIGGITNITIAPFLLTWGQVWSQTFT